MSETQYDIQSVKDRLCQYRETQREIENQSQMIETIVAMMEGIGAQNITDMPKSHSPNNDRFTDLLTQKAEIEEEIGEILEHQKEERKYFQNVLRHVKRADERAVIRFRYLLCMSWDGVANALFGNTTDYLGKEESYLRRVTKLHGRALEHMATYIADQAEKH